MPNFLLLDGQVTDAFAVGQADTALARPKKAQVD
jgi:hypothetical protein